MQVDSRRPKGREDAISALNASIKGLNLAENASGTTPAKAAFASVNALLTAIKEYMAGEPEYVELGLLCASICQALDRGTNGKKQDELSQSACDAMNLLTSTVADIRKKLIRWGKQNVVSRRLHAKKDKETTAAWKLVLDGVLQVFSKELVTDANAAGSSVHDGVINTHAVISDVQKDVPNPRNILFDTHHNTLKPLEDTRGRLTHARAPGEFLPLPLRNALGTASDIRYDVVKTRAMVSDMHRTMMTGQEGSGSGGGNVLTRTSGPGESPPPPPRACFGRGELIEKIIGLAENLSPVALIGPGGIGKTSIALAALHHENIRKRFGGDRRFIRCDQFPASRAHLLNRLSKVIGAGVDNPEDLASLRPLLSSREMLIILDNAESILDPGGTDAEGIYAVVEELSRFGNVCLCITSRITAVPSDCETVDVPILPIEAGRETFYRIYRNTVERIDIVDKILVRLDFHPLSITLLATVAHQNKWGMDRLAREWEGQRTRMLQPMHNKSFAATIELSLTSPMFRELGPDARGLLEVVAFFPQGVDENKLDRLFPTVSNRTNVIDKFCALSLTHRSGSFITMLAPLRDHLRPKDPMSSPLLCATKEQYFTRMSVCMNPNGPYFGETRWITSEDVNVEHLLDVFTMVDANSDSVWTACSNFILHLYWHKPRLTVLRPRIEGLPDRHQYKPRCLSVLARLLESVGNCVECKRLLTHTLQLWRERGDDYGVVVTLRTLSYVNRQLDLHEEAIRRAKEALEILERLDNTVERARCLIELALSSESTNQFDSAEEAAFRAMDIFSEKGDQFEVCQTHFVLGRIYRSKGEIEKAIHHFETALGLASSSNWTDQLTTVHFGLATLFFHEGRLDDAQAHVEQIKLHAVNDVYRLGGAMFVQAILWCGQQRLEEARAEFLRAADVFERFGDTERLMGCRVLLQLIEEKTKKPVT